LRQRIRHLIEHQIDLSADQILHGRSGASIRDERKARAREALEECAADACAGASGSLRGLAGVGLEPSDQLGQVIGWYGLACDDQLWIAGQERNRREIVQQAIGKREDGPVEHMGGPHSHAERIAVRSRAHGTADPDRAGCAGHVLDHDGLAERRPHALGHDASDPVGRSAGRERNDHGDRT